MQPSFFDFEDRWEDLRNLNAAQVLVRLHSQIDWEIFRVQLKTIRLKERKSRAGRKPFDVILMFKIMILQSLYNLSDEQAEFQIKDRMSFMQFLGLNWQSRVPDQKTIWLFREQLTQAGLVKPLFERFEQILVAQGYEARRGQMVDATLVNVPIQRNPKDENEQVKEGAPPLKTGLNQSVAKKTSTLATPRSARRVFSVTRTMPTLTPSTKLFETTKSQRRQCMTVRSSRSCWGRQNRTRTFMRTALTAAKKPRRDWNKATTRAIFTSGLTVTSN